MRMICLGEKGGKKRGRFVDKRGNVEELAGSSKGSKSEVEVKKRKVEDNDHSNVKKARRSSKSDDDDDDEDDVDNVTVVTLDSGDEGVDDKKDSPKR